MLKKRQMFKVPSNTTIMQIKVRTLKKKKVRTFPAPQKVAWCPLQSVLNSPEAIIVLISITKRLIFPVLELHVNGVDLYKV